MEMEIRVVQPQMQAAFMLQALRELREDSRVAKKKRQESESADKGTILGPLLGPAIPSDKKPAPEPPEGFVLPENLEFVGLEVDLPVGFKRLRWALLSKESKFVTDAIFAAEAKYDKCVLVLRINALCLCASNVVLTVLPALRFRSIPSTTILWEYQSCRRV